MKQILLRTLLVTAAVLIAISAKAQMEMPKPAPELKKLDYFVGSWTLEGDMKPGPMGPGGKFTGSETDEWMEGGFFVKAHEEFKIPMGNGAAEAFMGYDTNDKTYTYHSFSTSGEAEAATGKFEGNTWTWNSEEHMGAQTMKGRYTATVLSPTSYAFKFEVSPDGSSWATVMDGTATKK